MTVPRGSLRTFLASAKSNLQNAIINQQRITLVMGNESADLDSITSALLFAFVESNAVNTPRTSQSVSKHTLPSQNSPLYIPLLNIPRADLKIRPELLALLPHANIESSHLITLDDLSTNSPTDLDPNGRQELSPKNTNLILTDHNKLAGLLAARGFSDRVIGCIDHHIDENTIPQNTAPEPRIIRTAGSCTSLVVQYCRSAWDSLSTSASSTSSAASGQDDAPSVVVADDTTVRQTWDAQLATLAIASILIDTSALKDKDKTTPTDHEAVTYLESKIAQAPSQVTTTGTNTGTAYSREALYHEISTAKKDLTALSTTEILRKDYKQWEVNGRQLGVSSAVKPLKWQVEKAGGADQFMEQLGSFAAERNLDLCAVMTTSTSREDGKFQRELLLWSPVKGENDEVVEKFAQTNEKALGLEAWKEVENLEAKDSGRLEVWWQRKVDMSRKQVAPLLRKATEG